MRALITGAAGQLGTDLVALLGDQAHAYSHSELDISSDSAVARAFAETEPEVVINCAAFHNLDVCEREPANAFAINVEAVRRLAGHAVPLVHVSTNYVFDGRSPEPYGEDDLPSPRSIYAVSKLAGEYAALAYGRSALVVRTAGLYGLSGNASKGGNFVQRVLARARAGSELSVVDDQRLQPTYTADLAPAILEAIEARAQGIIHLTAGGACSWWEFTRAIMAHAGLEVEVKPARTVSAPGGVDRPLNGVLARPRADSLGLSPLRPWDEALADYIDTAGLAQAQSIDPVI
jgi:dTDP-4-dehydrorhamnose reductase